MKITAKKSAMVLPIIPSQQQEVIEQTHYFIQLGNKLLGYSFGAIPVFFDLKGRAAGMYKVTGRRHRVQRRIRYNPWIFSKYYENNLTVTVPHEVAHYLVDCIYGLRHVRPHGVEWKTIMNIFGVDSSVTSIFDLTGIPVRHQQQVNYRCGCKTHQLGIRRHSKVLHGKANYLCRHCGEILQLEKFGIGADQIGKIL